MVLLTEHSTRSGRRASRMGGGRAPPGELCSEPESSAKSRRPIRRPNDQQYLWVRGARRSWKYWRPLPEVNGPREPGMGSWAAVFVRRADHRGRRWVARRCALLRPTPVSQRASKAPEAPHRCWRRDVYRSNRAGSQAPRTNRSPEPPTIPVQYIRLRPTIAEPPPAETVPTAIARATAPQRRPLEAGRADTTSELPSRLLPIRTQGASRGRATATGPGRARLGPNRHRFVATLRDRAEGFESSRVAEFSLGQPSLDEVFLALTGQCTEEPDAAVEEEVA